MRGEWLKSVKPGDEVIVSGGGPMSRSRVKKVERLTKTQIVLDNGMKYRIGGGCEVGDDSWRSTFLRESTPESINKIKREDMHGHITDRLSDMKWREKSLEELSEIWSLIKKQGE